MLCEALHQIKQSWPFQKLTVQQFGNTVVPISNWSDETPDAVGGWDLWLSGWLSVKSTIVVNACYSAAPWYNWNLNKMLKICSQSFVWVALKLSPRLDRHQASSEQSNPWHELKKLTWAGMQDLKRVCADFCSEVLSCSWLRKDDCH